MLDKNLLEDIQWSAEMTVEPFNDIPLHLTWKKKLSENQCVSL